jgi:flagellar hook-associated protein 3 FlgL
MRISTNMLSEALTTQLTNLTGQMATLQKQASTGLQFTQLDENPTGMESVLNLQDQDSENSQFTQNITALQQMATGSYGAMSSLQTLAQKASDIATEADGTDSSQQLATYATQITQIIQQAAQLMNTQNAGGEYIFGGTATSTPPYVVTTNAAGDVTGVTYQGNSSVSSIEIAPGETLTAQVPGSNTSGTGPGGLITDSRSGADFFNHLIALQNDLQSGNVTTIASTDIPALAKDEDNITTQISTNGIIQSQLNVASSMVSAKSTSLDTMITQDVGADMATTATQLSAVENAFQAALQTGASLLNENQSLLYYLE